MQRKLICVVAALSAVAALMALFLSFYEFAPRINRDLHRAIGRTLAREALELAGREAKITVITRDTGTFPQPAIDILLMSLKRELRRADALIVGTQLIQTDPLRPVEVPSGDFYELIRRSPAGHVIVSLLGPPLLTEDQRAKLGSVKPRIVAFCSGNASDRLDLGGLFNAGLLHAAIVSRQAPADSKRGIRRRPESFEELYDVVKASDLLKSRSALGAPL